ncbi:MAG TPA: ABC transporter permease [Candidatus Dormibacteraeota bacterium]|nr:ABC transporter permease [Candidatus Dormibacteraeota bacterium]
MKIWAIALNTLGTFLRNRLLIVFAVVFVCTLLLFMTPLLGMKALTQAGQAQQAQLMVLNLVSGIMFFVSGTGSLLAAWCAADSVSSELKSGTILAVMARPVKRWEFLLGKYLGVILLMSFYVVMMYGLSWLLAWVGGAQLHSTTWVLFAYPLVRYAIYAAIALALVTLIHPIASMGLVLILAVVALIVEPGGKVMHNHVQYLKVPLWILLPSTSLLSEERFLTITHAALKQATWLEHLTTLAYGLDYALVFLLLAIWSFRYRSLTHD